MSTLFKRFVSEVSPSHTGQTRYLTDPNAEATLRLFEKIVASGKHLALMAHFVHDRELATDASRSALARIRSTGAVVYCQAPLLAHINDNADVWSALWRQELALGAVPYYLFVERDTGPYEYFKVPFARVLEIIQSAFSTLLVSRVPSAVP